MLRKTESGQTLIMALALLAVGSLLVLPVLTSTFTNLNYNRTIECQTLNDYAADAGIQYATCQIYNDAGTYTQSPLSANFTLNGRTVNVGATYQGGGLYSINSTASGGGCGRTTIRSFVNLSHGAFAYTLAAKQDLTIMNSNVDTFPDPGIGADIHANNNIVITGPKKSTKKIWGDATAVGTVSDPDGFIEGTSTPDSDNVTFPLTNAALYATIAMEGEDSPHIGDLQYSGGGTYSVGPLYITGNLVIDAGTTVELEGPLYILGTIQINNGYIVGNEHIISEGNVTITGGAYFGNEFVPVITSLYGDIQIPAPAVVEAVLYAPNGTVYLSNMQLFGAAGGAQITLDNCDIRYSEQLQGRADLPGSELYPLTYSYD